MCAVLSHPVRGDLLQQPQETHTTWKLGVREAEQGHAALDCPVLCLPDDEAYFEKTDLVSIQQDRGSATEQLPCEMPS